MYIKNHPNWQLRLSLEGLRSDWHWGTNGWSDVQQRHSHFNFDVDEIGGNETGVDEIGGEETGVDEIGGEETGVDGADVDGTNVDEDEAVVDKIIIGEIDIDVEDFGGSKDDIVAPNSVPPWVSFELFDKISTEGEFSSKLSLAFFFYFERKIIWLCLPGIGIRKG